MEVKDQNGNINCVGCEDCRNCIDCVNCKGCSNCVGCTGCAGCYSCVGCDNCNLCSGSTNCKDSNNLYQCVLCVSENNMYYLDLSPEDEMITASDSSIGYSKKISFMGDLSVKDLDIKKGIVQFYAGTYEMDSVKDVIVKSAYKKTLAENKSRIKHFKNHNQSIQPGVIQDIECDNKGLLVTSLLLKTTVGLDTLIEYEFKAITEHSQGYKPIPSQIEYKDGGRIIKEVELWEVSSLNNWGANMDTPTISLKSKSEASIQNHAAALHNILHKSAISDERAVTLEKELTLITKHLHSLKPNLFTSEPKKSSSLFATINKSK